METDEYKFMPEGRTVLYSLLRIKSLIKSEDNGAEALLHHIQQLCGGFRCIQAHCVGEMPYDDLKKICFSKMQVSFKDNPRDI